VKIIKSVRKHSTLKGFYRGLGVVKGEGVAAAKKALPFPLKIKNKFKNLNFSHISKNLNPQKRNINLKFKFLKNIKFYL
ncbi:hypothetical protein, partial [Campylobacter lanienae]|uniref:hypothetical protein n=1 Tax=Campylobacter lanienae TaxID=75658 RepID=UPI001F28C354